jgi:hypothetical protein
MSGTTITVKCPICERVRAYTMPAIMTVREDYCEIDCACGATLHIDAKMQIEITATAAETPEEAKAAFLWDSRCR